MDCEGPIETVDKQDLNMSYMPYLTLWDKISQNFGPSGPISHKIFKSHRISIPFNKLFFEELEINHTLAWLSQA